MQPYLWNVRLVSTSEEKVTAHAGKRQFDIRMALNFDETQEGVSAIEYVLAAVGADVLSGFQRLLRQKRIAVDRAEANVQGSLNNPLVHLGVIGEEGNPGLERIRVKVYVSCSAREAEVQEIWREALRRSPLAVTFSGLIEFDPSLKLVV